MRNRVIEIKPGDKFGKLTIMKELPTRKRPPRTYDRMFLCSCDCGNQFVTAMSGLRRGTTRSCGCLIKERGKIKNNNDEYPDKRLKHIWYGMLTRCKGRNEKDFRNYASRNIKVCDEWASNFEAFKNWALTNGYSSTLTIDRIDGSKGYSPDNCRWATVKQQMNNVRYNVILKKGNESHTIAEWSEIIGVNAQSLYERKYRGWDDERTLNTPIRTHKKKEQ